MVKKAENKDESHENNEELAKETAENNQDTSLDEGGNAQDSAEKHSSISDKIKEKAKEFAGKSTNDEEYKAKIAELEDKMLRVAAEGQNIRRRAMQDIEKAKHFSIESFARDLTPVLENLFRASESITEEDAQADERLKTTKDGIEITKNELLKAFEKHGLKRVSPKGEAFDHNFHQAMSQVEDNEKPANTVLEVIQAGYTIKDRLINPALVIVSKKSE